VRESERSGDAGHLYIGGDEVGRVMMAMYGFVPWLYVNAWNGWMHCGGEECK